MITKSENLAAVMMMNPVNVVIGPGDLQFLTVVLFAKLVHGSFWLCYFKLFPQKYFKLLFQFL